MVEVAEERLAAELEDLLERAGHGEVVVVTRDGRPFVQLLAVGEQDTSPDPRAAQEALRRVRTRAERWGIQVDADEWKSWVNEGRD